MDRDTFSELTARHRRELHVHCYRLLGSFEDADDLVQETFLRAWRARAEVRDDGLRAWLYKIATNACLDAIRSRKRRAPYLQPYPDTLLDELSPDQVVVERESIELAFLAAIQLLPPRQRAVLLLRDVLDWSAAETARLLDLTVPAANSALQRARTTLRGTQWTPAKPSGDEQALLADMIEAHHHADVDHFVRLVREDIRVHMPPEPLRYQGVESMRPLFDIAFGPEGMGDWRLLPTSVNRTPAAASYLRRPGEVGFRPFKLDVFRMVDGLVTQIHVFDARMFDDLGLPKELGDDA
ncbi:sigma-70 family RNA polymerase sigma factor [Kutzneria sp. CA-103260]|uniref:sigma-70 family RNA polymerase sigma factor n=1 Tax=Kutzneria sp. CA-103260 TaxID=2802641 RepID=UPI002011D8C3|nr:sigma-70 family RNA polymerase sigma factor [Kutzneria sp. CA-103260]